MSIHPWDAVLGGIFIAEVIVYWLLPFSSDAHGLGQLVGRFLYPLPLSSFRSVLLDRHICSCIA